MNILATDPVAEHLRSMCRHIPKSWRPQAPQALYDYQKVVYDRMGMGVSPLLTDRQVEKAVQAVIQKSGGVMAEARELFISAMNHHKDLSLSRNEPIRTFSLDKLGWHAAGKTTEKKATSSYGKSVFDYSVRAEYLAWHEELEAKLQRKPNVAEWSAYLSSILATRNAAASLSKNLQDEKTIKFLTKICGVRVIALAKQALNTCDEYAFLDSHADSAAVMDSVSRDDSTLP